MKKGALLILLLFSLLALSLVSAANETYVDKAYSCLESKVKSKCSSLSLEDQSFSLLALASYSSVRSDCKTALLSKEKNSECFPSTACDIKDTALATLALDAINENTDKEETWLWNHNITSSDLEWYLEIDSSSALSCTVSHDSTSTRITISDAKKISSFSDSCLSLAYNSNWMKIASSCLKKKFTISCDKDFFSALLYKKPSSSVWFLPSATAAGSSSSQTEHQINFYCFSIGSTCDYEDNLWAALVLQKKGFDISGVLPLLMAYRDDNLRLFPDSFLFILLSTEEYLKNILSVKNTAGFWETETGKRFYNTAEGLLALSSSQSSSDASTTAKSWLEKNTDPSTGCWNSGNVRDTAFLLWAGWPKAYTGGGTTTTDDCRVDGKGYCMTSSNCLEVDGAYSGLSAFKCTSALDVCCDKPAKQKTCSEQDGVKCPSSQQCDISTISASDESDCCTGSCVAITSECEQQGYSCSDSCSSSEVSANYNCAGDKVCCKPKPIEPGKSYWWLWLLIILIILVVLAIIFRDRLRLFIFKIKGRFGSQPVTKTRPGFTPPASGSRPFMPFQGQPPRKPASKTDYELDETFKKLKEMSK